MKSHDACLLNTCISLAVQLLNMNGLSRALNEGGYDYKFIEEPADYLKCLICLLVVREPQQHGGCGKLFCKVCIDKHTNTCPHCRQPLNNSNGFPTIFNDFRSKWLDFNNYGKQYTKDFILHLI